MARSSRWKFAVVNRAATNLCRRPPAARSPRRPHVELRDTAIATLPPRVGSVARSEDTPPAAAAASASPLAVASTDAELIARPTPISAIRFMPAGSKEAVERSFGYPRRRLAPAAAEVTGNHARAASSRFDSHGHSVHDSFIDVGIVNEPGHRLSAAGSRPTVFPIAES